MFSSEIFVRNNNLTRRDANGTLSKFIEKTDWKPNEVVSDIGCGPGNMTYNTLYPLLKNKIKQLVSSVLIIVFCELYVYIHLVCRSVLINRKKW